MYGLMVAIVVVFVAFLLQTKSPFPQVASPDPRIVPTTSADECSGYDEVECSNAPNCGGVYDSGGCDQFDCGRKRVYKQCVDITKIR